MGRFTQTKKAVVKKAPTARKSTCPRPTPADKLIPESKKPLNSSPALRSGTSKIKKLGKPDAVTIKKLRRRYMPSYVDIREIQRCQKATENAIPRLSFQRVVREVVEKMGLNYRFQAAALSALQESAEAYLVGVFEDTNLVTLHGKRKAILVKDLRLAYRIRGDYKLFA